MRKPEVINRFQAFAFNREIVMILNRNIYVRDSLARYLLIHEYIFVAHIMVITMML
jgi:hypothetical protein